MSVAQMNERTVHVFLGHPLADPTERSFLQRLRCDLEQRGIPALILANLEVGSSHRQLDFVIVSSARAVHCELKGYRAPVIGRANGVWEQVLPDGKRRSLDGNPYRQARDGTYALSDELRNLARRRGDMPAGPQGKFYKGIDTVVCLYPEVPQGSQLGTWRYSNDSRPPAPTCRGLASSGTPSFAILGFPGSRVSLRSSVRGALSRISSRTIGVASSRPMPPVCNHGFQPACSSTVERGSSPTPPHC